MMPKESKLTRKLRIIIMLSLISAFLIISPLLLLYTAGYRFNPYTFNILQTGALSIDITPKDTTVYINNRKIEQNIPIRLADSAQGNYQIRLEKNGYHTWQKDVFVESNKTTYIRDISLLANSLPITTKLSNEIEPTQFVASPNSPFAIFFEFGSSSTHFNLFNAEEIETSLLMSTLTAKEISIDWSPFAPIAAITVSIDNTRMLYLIDPVQDTISAERVLSSKDTYSWSHHDPKTVLITTPNNQVDLFSIDSNITLGFASSTKTYLTQNNEIASIIISDDSEYIHIAHSSVPLLLPETIDTIIHLTETILIGRQEDKIIIFKREGDLLTHIDTIDGNQIFSSGETNFIAWSPRQIWIITPFGDTRVLYRTRDTIQHIIPFNEQGELLIVSTSGLSVFNPAYYTSTKLYDSTKIITTILDRSSNTIYFDTTTSDSKHIYSLEY